MSVIVNIKHPKETKIDYKFLLARANFENLYVGIQDEAFCIEDYKGKDDIRSLYFVLFSKVKFHRGFSFKVDKNYNVELVLNYPCTKRDVLIFYKFINDYCLDFDITTFTEEGEEHTLEDIPKLQEEKIEFNKKLIRDELKSGLTIFGAVYPITLDDNFILNIRYLTPDKALNAFANYLDKLQHPMYYFAKPLLCECNKKDKYIAKYVLTKDVPSIFPSSTYLPFGYDAKYKDNISLWQVVIVDNPKDKEEKLVIYGELSYEDFCKSVNIRKHRAFDKEHVLITIDDKLLHKIDKKLIENAKEKMLIWLSDYRELGCMPKQIAFTKRFKTDDGIDCYIFKYKKNVFSKWWLGIVSDAGTFSEFKEYKKETEIDDAKKIIDLLKSLWKREAERLEKKENYK